MWAASRVGSPSNSWIGYLGEAVPGALCPGFADASCRDVCGGAGLGLRSEALLRLSRLDWRAADQGFETSRRSSVLVDRSGKPREALVACWGSGDLGVRYEREWMSKPLAAAGSRARPAKECARGPCLGRSLRRREKDSGLGWLCFASGGLGRLLGAPSLRPFGLGRRGLVACFGEGRE